MCVDEIAKNIIIRAIFCHKSSIFFGRSVFYEEPRILIKTFVGCSITEFKSNIKVIFYTISHKVGYIFGYKSRKLKLCSRIQYVHAAKMESSLTIYCYYTMTS